MPKVKNRLATFLIAAALLGLCLWVYFPALQGTWVWDDGEEIVRNAVIRGPLSALVGAWSAPSGPDYFPLKVTLQWIEWHLWGNSPLGYHLVSVGLHSLSALLLWRLLTRLGLSYGWVGALVFIVHPQAVESVAWIAELKNTLSVPLLLLASLFFVDYSDRSARSEEGARGYWILSLAAYAASLLAKSSGVMFPVVILAYGWWRWGEVRKKEVLASLPFFGVSLVLGLVTVWYQVHRAIGVASSVHPFPLGVRLGNAGHGFLFYLSKAVVPSGLAPLYPVWSFDALSGASVMGWALVVAAACACWVGRSTWGRHLALGLGWFFLNLVPVLGVIPMAFSRLAGASDHFAYLSLIGIAGLAAGAAQMIWRWCGPSGAGLGLAAILVLVGMGLLATQSRGLAGNYQSDEAFWRAAVRANAASWIAHNNLGLIEANRGELDQAVAEYGAALSSGGGVAELQNNLGQALARLGRLDEARQHLLEALRQEPNFFDARVNLGNALAQSGRFADAAEEYSRALGLQPRAAQVQCYLGYALLQAGRASEAEGHLREAIRLEPGFAEPHLRLGDLLGNSGRMQEAFQAYREAIALNPNYAEAYASLGLAYALVHRPADALDPLGRAIALRPNYTEAHAYLGYALSGLGRNIEAVGQYREALKTGASNPEIHYNLGMALRALGRYSEARAEFNEAQRLERHP